MAIKLNSARQELEVAHVDINMADLASGSAANAIELPPNAVVVGGDVVVTTAFNSGTSDNITVGDATTANRYLGSTSIAATGRTALVPTGFTVTTTQRFLQVTWTGVGTAATTGVLRLAVQFYVKGRAEMSYGLGT